MHMDEAPTHRASEQHGAWFSFQRLGGFGPTITANKSMPSADERPRAPPAHGPDGEEPSGRNAVLPALLARCRVFGIMNQRSKCRT